MKIEYEATFYPIIKDDARERLTAVGAHLEYPERLMRRVTFNLPEGHASIHTWARVRDEGDKVTMSVKEVTGGTMEGQKEEMVVIDSFEHGIAFLTALGCTEKAYQETKRELWTLGEVEITIDSWPWIEPLVEIEGKDETDVRVVAERLGFAWSDAKFYPSGAIYMEKYGMTENKINNDTPRIVFEGQNPFI